MVFMRFREPGALICTFCRCFWRLGDEGMFLCRHTRAPSFSRLYSVHVEENKRVCAGKIKPLFSPCPTVVLPASYAWVMEHLQCWQRSWVKGSFMTPRDQQLCVCPSVAEVCSVLFEGTGCASCRAQSVHQSKTSLRVPRRLRRPLPACTLMSKYILLATPFEKQQTWRAPEGCRDFYVSGERKVPRLETHLSSKAQVQV